MVVLTQARGELGHGLWIISKGPSTFLQNASLISSNLSESKFDS